jgi:hypothetical protein
VVEPVRCGVKRLCADPLVASAGNQTSLETAPSQKKKNLQTDDPLPRSLPRITVNEHGGLYCEEPGTASSTSSSAHTCSAAAVLPVYVETSLAGASAAPEITMTDVREIQANGTRLEGSLEDIAAALRHVNPHYSWNPPANADTVLCFQDPIPWSQDTCTYQGLTKVEVEAIKWWLERSRFTAVHGTCGDGYSSRSCQTTFVEMAIAVEIETRVHLGGPDTDLARKVALLRTALRFLMGKCRPKLGEGKRKKAITFEAFFSPRKYIGSLEHITGQRLPGIFRGIAWRGGTRQTGYIAACAYSAGMAFHDLTKDLVQDTAVSGLHNRLPPFGTDFHLRLQQCDIVVEWRPGVLTAFQSEIAHAYIAIRTDDKKCHFGCVTRAKLKTQCLVPSWRGAKLGVGICTKCHTRLLSELNDKNTPLVTEVDQAFSLRPRLQGPCFFG